MRRLVLTLLLMFFLVSPAHAVTVPEDVEAALPESAEDILELEDLSAETGWTEGVLQILHAVGENFHEILARQTRQAVKVLLVVFLCGLADAGTMENSEKSLCLLPMAGSLAITALTVGSLDSLLGLGRETIHQLADFSKVLLPALAAAAAASGGLTSATMHQVTTVFFVELLLRLTETLLMPLLGCYTAVLTAGSCLGEKQLYALADGIRKTVTWTLCTVMIGFTGYLSAARILSGTADGATVRLTKAAISGVVPVVGHILSDAAESVLAGAGLLRTTIGLVGMLTILAACAYPFLRLGVQYLLYKLTAMLTEVLGVPQLGKLIGGLGSAFGLVLGMTGSCALLLLISILSCVSAVIS